MDTTIIHNPQTLDHHIGFDKQLEPPLTVQLGGYNPDTLGKAVELCESYGGFNEINLNCGCPSNKAKKCGFGAELMLDPELVRQIVTEMKRKSSSCDISVKCRIGLNVKDTWGDLVKFVLACKAGGVNKMVIHARICVLCGLSPAQNRNVPPLRYDIVSRLIEAFPDMKFVLNGGVRSFAEADNLLGYNSGTKQCSSTGLPSALTYSSSSSEQSPVRSWEEVERAWDLTERLSLPFPGYAPATAAVAAIASTAGITTSHSETVPGSEPLDSGDRSDNEEGNDSCGGSNAPSLWSLSTPVHGVMIGREAYNNPWAWANLDHHYYNTPNPALSRREVLEEYLTYAEAFLQGEGPRTTIPYLCKPLHNFFTGCAANKLYKRKLDHLLKVHVTHMNATRRSHTRSITASFGEIVREAVQDTIPDAFLDERMGPDGSMIYTDTE